MEKDGFLSKQNKEAKKCQKPWRTTSNDMIVLNQENDNTCLIRLKNGYGQVTAMSLLFHPFKWVDYSSYSVLLHHCILLYGYQITFLEPTIIHIERIKLKELS